MSLIKEIATDFLPHIHLPRLVLSVRQRLFEASQSHMVVDITAMSQDDQTIVDSQWYSERATPSVDPGTPAWWLEGDEPVVVKVEDVDDGTDNSVGMSEKAKGKQKAVEAADAMIVDSPAPVPETDPEVDGDGGKGPGKAPTRKREDRDATKPAAQDRPAKRAKVNPPTDAPSNVMACPRCVKQGRPCINEPGRACAQCRKSKVKCPLFNGQRGKSRAPTEAPTAGTSSAAGRPPSPPTSGRHLPRMVPSSWARAPTPATPAQQPAPAGKKPKPTASRTSGMSTICYIRTSLKTPTKAPPW